MSIDELELRSRLAETALLAGPPRFTTAGLAAHVRRIRRRRLARAGIATFGVAAVAAAIAVPLTVGATAGLPGREAMPAPAAKLPGEHLPPSRESVPPRTPTQLSYTVTVDGQQQADGRRTGTIPLFTISPGKKLIMSVKVTVPGRQPVTALWLGIINGVVAAGHANFRPVLEASREPLRPGAHRFVLRWTVPSGIKPGTTRQLAAAWQMSRSAGVAGTEVADFAVPLPAASRTAVERRIRASVMHGLANCNGTKPESILAVRTTFRSVMAIPEVGQGDNITEPASRAVYLVVMKGDFTSFTGPGKPPSGACSRTPPATRYVEAVFDAATFVELEEGFLGNRPFPVPLQTLGRVLRVPA